MATDAKKIAEIKAKKEAEKLEKAETEAIQKLALVFFQLLERVVALAVVELLAAVGVVHFAAEHFQLLGAFQLYVKRIIHLFP